MAGEQSGAFSLARELLEMIVGELRRYPERVYEVLRGRRVAEEIADFYREISEAGMPEDLVKELTRLYAEKLLEGLRPLATLYIAGVEGGARREAAAPRPPTVNLQKLIEMAIVADRRARAAVAAAVLRLLGVPQEKIEEVVREVREPGGRREATRA